MSKPIFKVYPERFLADKKGQKVYNLMRSNLAPFNKNTVERYFSKSLKNAKDAKNEISRLTNSKSEKDLPVKLIGEMTGNSMSYSENGKLYTFYEVKLEQSAIEEYKMPYGRMWFRNDNITLKLAKSEIKEKGSTTIQNILQTDFKLYHMLKMLEAYIGRLKAAGKDASTFEARYKKLADNYNERQKTVADLKNKGLLSNLTAKVSEKLLSAYDWIKGKLSGTEIGILPAVVLAYPWVSAGVVIAATAGSAYIWEWLAKGPEKQAQADWDESGKLEIALKEAAKDGVFSEEEKKKFQALKTEYGQQMYDGGYKEAEQENAGSVTGTINKAIAAAIFIGGGTLLYKSGILDGIFKKSTAKAS